MKKAIMAIGLVLFVACGVFAQVSVAGQTLYYKYVNTVDPETGVRSLDTNIWIGGSSPVPTEVYITFTRNGCYTSDEKGIEKYVSIMTVFQHVGGNIPYSYQGEQNNMFVFKSYLNNDGLGRTKTNYILFSKDYKRINFNASWGSFYKQNVYVYEQATPPQKETEPVGPDRMW